MVIPGAATAVQAAGHNARKETGKSTRYLHASLLRQCTYRAQLRSTLLSDAILPPGCSPQIWQLMGHLRAWQQHIATPVATGAAATGQPSSASVASGAAASRVRFVVLAQQCSKGSLVQPHRVCPWRGATEACGLLVVVCHTRRCRLRRARCNAVGRAGTTSVLIALRRVSPHTCGLLYSKLSSQR